MNSIRNWLSAIVGASALFATTVSAQSFSHSAYLDLDNNPATGCAAVTAAGAVSGIEARLTATVSGQPPLVTTVTRENCVGAGFGGTQAQAAGYPVGLNNGTSGADVVEFATSLSGLGTGGPARIVFVSASASGADQVTANGVIIQGTTATGFPTPALIPATGLLTLLLLVGLVLWLARKHPGFGSSMALLLLLGVGVVWAANFVTDGQISDWIGVSPRAIDASNDSTSGEGTIDLVAVFAETEAGSLFLRADVRDAQNQPPVAAAQSVMVNEDGSIQITLMGTDPEGAPLVFALAPPVPTRGGLSAITPINATSAFVTYTPSANQNGDDSFGFTVSDGTSTSSPATILVTITPINDPPVVAAQTLPVVENSANGTVVGTATATDVDTGQTLTWAITGGNALGAFAINAATGQITVADAADITPANSPFSLTVQATDNGVAPLSGSNTITINVTGVNDEPSFTAGPAQAVNEDAAAQSLPWATAISPGPADEAGQTVAFTVSNDNTTLFAVQPAVSPTGTLTYTLAANANGVANVAVFLVDNGGTTGGGDDTSPTQNFTITVTAVNDVPSFAVGPTQNVLQNSGAATVPNFATALSAGPADESGQTLTFAASNDNNALFSAQPAIAPNGTLTFTPANNAVGTATVTVTLQDNGGVLNGGVDTSGPQQFVINVTIVNQAPSFTATTDPAASLEDGGPQTVAGFVTGISDGDATVVQTVNFNITGNTNAALFLAGPAIDVNGQLTYTANPNANGSADITFVAQDDGGTGNGGSDTSAPDTFTITVTAVNDVPSFLVGPTQNVLQNSGPAIVVTFATALSAGPTDESGQTLTFSATNDNNALFSAQPAIASNGTLTFTPANNAVGTATVTVTLQDNGGVLNGGVDTSGPQQFIINVTIVNQAPSFTATTDPAASLEDGGPQTVAGFVTGINDGDATVVQTVNFNITGNTNAGLFLAGPAIDVNGQLTYTANPNANGSADITFVAQDDGGTGNGGSDTSAPDTFTITVTPVNDVPSFLVGADQNVPQDSPAQTVNGFATAISRGPADEAGQTLTFAVNVTVGGALFSVAPDIDEATGNLTYTPAAGQTGTATVSVVLSDNGGIANGGVDTSLAQTFTITLDDVNEVPVPTALPASPISLPENSPAATVVTDIAPNDPDAGQTHTYAFQSGNTGNVFAVDAAGVITVVGTLDFETLASYTLVVRVTDNGLNPPNLFADISITVNVTDVNEAPAVTAGGTLAYTEGDGAVVLNSTVTVTDQDAGEGLASATVQITGNLASAEDVLAFTNTANITGVYTAATGTLALTGADTPAAYQAALQSVTYANPSNDPSTLQRTVSWTVNDGALASNTATSTIDITTTNSPPVPTANPVSPIALPENSPAATVVTDIAPNDPEVGQTHTYTFQSGNTGNVFGVDAAGVITVVGTLDFETLASYTLVVRVTDNGAPSQFADISITVNVTDVNEAPAVTAGGTLAYTEGNGVVVLNNTVTVTDPDAGEGLASATVQITGNLASAEDVLAFTNTANITGVYTAATGTLALTGADTPAAYQAALQSVTYQNTSNSPSTLQRTVSWSVNDGALGSNVATSTIDITTTNSAPVVTTSGGSTAYVENGPAVAIDAAVTATDVDSPNATSALVQITGGLQTAQDVLGFVNTPNITGIYSPATGELQLSGTDTFANYQLALASVTYANNSDAPNTGNRTISFSVIDNGAPGLGSNVATKTVTVAAANDAPVVTLSGSTPSFTEGGAPVVVDSGVAVTDVDDTNMESATVTITNAAAGDVLTGTGGGAVNVAGSGTATLTLTGSDSLAVYNAVLQGVTFSNTSDAPSTTARIVRFVANDGDVNSANADKTVTVVAVNDAPVNTVPVTPSVNEDTALTFTGATVISVADVDVAAGSMTVTLTATQGTVNADDTGGAGIVGDNSANVTLTGTLAQINATLDGTIFNPTLNYFGPASLTVGTSDNGNTGTPGALTDTDLISITVNPVNDAPVASDESWQTYGNTELRLDLAAAATPHVIDTTASATGVRHNDTDPVESHTHSVVGIVGCVDVTAPFNCTLASGAVVVMESDGKFSFTPDEADLTDSFVYTLQDAPPVGEGSPAQDTGTVSLSMVEMVWYVNASAPGGGNGTSNAPLQNFTGITGAGGAGDGDDADDYIYVHNSNVTNGIELEAGQRLLGEAVALNLGVAVNGDPIVNLRGAGTRPTINTAGANAVSIGNAIPREIRGLGLQGATNAVDLTTTAATTGVTSLLIDNNEMNGAGAEGIDVNANSSTALTLAISNNAWNVAGTHTGNAIDIANTNVGAATLRLDLSNNTNLVSTASGVLINGGAAVGPTLITGFANNTVHGNTGLFGMNLQRVIFDGVSGNPFTTVAGGTTVIGASGNRVGTSGLRLEDVRGDLGFASLNIFNSNGTGLFVTSTGVFNAGGGTGFRLVNASTTDSLVTTGGPGANISNATVTLNPATYTVTGSSTFGLNLDTVAGTFTAGTSSSIASPTVATGTAFRINGSSVTSTFDGSIAATQGTGVSLTTNSGVMTFRGGMSLSTATNPAFTATGGGTVHVCDENPCNVAATGGLVNTLTTTTATALNVATTSIGANGLEFRSISSNGAASGIVLNATGAAGGLKVAGDGGGTQNASGGLIQNSTGVAISLTNTRNVTLNQLNVSNGGNHGINISSVTNFTYQDAVMFGVADGNDEQGINSLNLFGTSLIEDVTMDDIEEDGIQIRQNLVDDGTIDTITIRRLNIQDHVAGFGESGIEAQPDLASNLKVIVDDSDFTLNTNAVIAAQGSTAASHTGVFVMTIQNSTFNAAGSFGSGGPQFLGGGTGTVFYTVDNNQINSTKFTGLTLNSDQAHTSHASVTGNVFVASATSNGNGISMRQDENSTMNALVSGNNMTGFSSDGIKILPQDATVDDAGIEFAGSLLNNVSTVPTSGFGAGLYFEIINTPDPANFFNDTCMDVSGNNLRGTNTAAFFDFDLTLTLAEENGASLRVRQASEAALSTANTNRMVSTFAANPGGNPIVFNGGACTQPTLPP